MADLLAPLSSDQVTLLHVVAEPFLRDNVWPVWNYVERTLDDKGLDARELLESLPTVESNRSFGRKYSTVWYDRHALAPDARIQLTVAASLYLPDYNTAVGTPFIRILHVLTERYKSMPPSPAEVVQPHITKKDLLRVLPSLSPFLQTNLPDLLQHEPPTLRGPAWNPDGDDWRKDLDRDLLKYQGVTNVREYVMRITELVEADDAAETSKLVGMFNDSLNNSVLSAIIPSMVQAAPTVEESNPQPNSYVST